MYEIGYFSPSKKLWIRIQRGADLAKAIEDAKDIEEDITTIPGMSIAVAETIEQGVRVLLFVRGGRVTSSSDPAPIAKHEAA